MKKIDNYTYKLFHYGKNGICLERFHSNYYNTYGNSFYVFNPMKKTLDDFIKEKMNLFSEDEV